VNRLLWFTAGAGVGVYALARVRRAAEVLTADGLADRMAGWSVGLSLFREEVRAGAAEKENDLRERLGLPLPGGGPRALPGGQSGHLDRLDAPLDRLDHPTSREAER
jgi:uncharacterized protein DUF6167